MKTRFAIIGAGPTGLGAAYRLYEIGIRDFLVLDADIQAGGLSQSIVDAHGFTWDIGGHVLFSHYPDFDAAVDHIAQGENWPTHIRESWVWMFNRFIPYPLQNNIRHFPPEALGRCIDGLRHRPESHPVNNFEDWIRSSFGEGLAETFMIPYNTKVWAYAPRKLNFRWIGERVATVDLARIESNIAAQRDDVSWGPNSTFRFPLRGGTGAIWNRIADLIGRDRIRLERTVTRVNPSQKTLHLNTGETIHYEHLLSTMPLDQFTPLVEGLPASIVTRSKQLLYSSSHIVGIGIEGRPAPNLATKCWMYFPEPNVPFYRVTVFSNYSPNNVPDISRHYSLMAETSESPDRPVDRARVIDDTIRGLRDAKLVGPEDRIISTWSTVAEHGYPTPSVDRDAILQDVMPELEKRDVYSRGRFGAWKYEVANQDHSFMQGVEWVNRMVYGTRETVVAL